MLKAILFDLDGTLVDSLPDIVRSVNEVRRSRGFTSVTRGFCINYIGHGAEFLIQGCLPGMTDRTQLLQAVADYQRAYSSGPQKSKTFVGVEKGLKRLRETLPDLRFAVVTNKSTRLAVETLALLLPKPKIEPNLGADTVLHRKPDPGHATKALSLLGVNPEEALILGDDPVDCQLAEKSGVAFLGATWGYGKWTEQSRAPDEGMCEHFADFVERVIARARL